jgi:hypothetical protein
MSSHGRRSGPQHYSSATCYLLCLAAECEGEVSVDGALMELIEDHRRHAIEPGIGLEPAHQHALGDHEHARALALARLMPHCVAHLSADRLAEQRRHAVGGAARGHAPRLEHLHRYR